MRGGESSPVGLLGRRHILLRVREMRCVSALAFCHVEPLFGDATPGTPLEIETPDGATLADLVNQLKLPRKK